MPAAPATIQDRRIVVGALILATVSAVFPGFLIGALSVQVSDEFDVSEGTYGWGLGSFFLAATVGSIGLGRVAQRIGPRRQISAALAVTAVSQLALAAFASSFGLVIVALAVCGLANTANQTAVNLALTRSRISRLGLAMALKQSSMPTASLLSGFAVPVLALTVGWRWGYVAGAIIAVGALVAVRRVVDPIGPMRVTGTGVASASRDLWIAAMSGAFLAFSAGSLNAWVVGSGVDAGLDEGVAGLMLSVGAACGITLRLMFGWRLDAMTQRPFRMAAATVGVGVVGMVLLASRSSGVHVLATLVAFGGGWVWPVFTNFGIVRSNPEGAAAATGITQMGVYIGVFAGPLLSGWVIERSGYDAMWLVVAGTAALGAALTLVVAERF